MVNKKAVPKEIGKSSLNDMGLLVADKISAMLAYWDQNQVCRFANNAYIEWFGKSKEEMVDKITMKELLGPLYEKNLQYIIAALKGEKQIFEREIRLPNGEVRQALATYLPDIVDGNVRGFFVHVADVTYVKELEAQLLNARREMLRAVIQAQELERIELANALRDSVNQTLVFCRAIGGQKPMQDDPVFRKIMQVIHEAIDELNTLSTHLNPSDIELLGFRAGVENFIENYRARNSISILFDCSYENIEKIELTDKFSLFRIIQDFILLLDEYSHSTTANIVITRRSSPLVIELGHDDRNFSLRKEAKEFKDIEYRVEYYGGLIQETEHGKWKILSITLPILLSDRS